MRIGAAVTVWTLMLVALTAQSRSPFPGTLDQHPAIDYRARALTDVVTRMHQELAEGGAPLAFDDGPQGYLRAVLSRLQVPIESQVLLFSKTGIQHPFTRPENPRALYFNDRVVVGYIPGAPLVEMAAHDPQQGVIFQTLKQDGTTTFSRPDRCLGCHVSSNSLDVPGMLVRSMSTAEDGRPMPQDGSFIIDQRSPLEQRWAGWFVTGGATSVQSLGKPIDPRVDLSLYPQPTSDIAALLVFDHQGHAVNLLTRLGWETRVAAAENRIDFSKGDLGDILNEAVDYFLFVDEAKLASPVSGTSAFARVFSASGKHDRKGRSLRELDLQSRLFKYRCSYMIESPAFDALPTEARTAFLARLRARLTDRDTIDVLDDIKAGWR
jgi:hypothetical protein